MLAKYPKTVDQRIQVEYLCIFMFEAAATCLIRVGYSCLLTVIPLAQIGSGFPFLSILSVFIYFYLAMKLKIWVYLPSLLAYEGISYRHPAIASL